MVKRSKMFLIDAVIAVVLLALDQFTKYLAIERLKDCPAIPLIDGVLELSGKQRLGIRNAPEPEVFYLVCRRCLHGGDSLFPV